MAKQDNKLHQFIDIMKNDHLISKNILAQSLGLTLDELLANLLDWSDHLAFTIDADKIILDETKKPLRS